MPFVCSADRALDAERRLSPTTLSHSTLLKMAPGGPEWLLSSYKSPALSTWFLEFSRLATGSFGWPAYLVSQLFVSLTFALVFLLAKEDLGTERALAGTLLLTGVYYFSWPTPEFNQDVAQMPLGGRSALSLACHRNQTMGLVAPACPVWRGRPLCQTLQWRAAGHGCRLDDADRQARRTIADPRPWMALGLFLVLISPLLLWLIHNGFAPGAYAIARGQAHSFSGLGFILAQAEAAVPALVILWLAGLLGNARSRLNSIEGNQLEKNRRFGVYLMARCLTIAPILICILLTAGTGTGARRMWGVPMLNLVGLIAIWATSSRFTHKALQRIGVAAAALLITLPVAYVTATTLSPLLGDIKRPNWPQAQIATHMRDLWTQSTGQPLRIVAGDSTNWLSGLIAVACCERPAALFTDADPVRSPWITDERLAREGALVVWIDRGNGPAPRLAELIGSRPQHVAHFSIPAASPAAAIEVHYAIVQPRILR